MPCLNLFLRECLSIDHVPRALRIHESHCFSAPLCWKSHRNAENLCLPFPGGVSHCCLFPSEDEPAGKLAVVHSTLPCYQNIVQDSQVLSQNALRSKRKKNVWSVLGVIQWWLVEMVTQERNPSSAYIFKSSICQMKCI